MFGDVVSRATGSIENLSAGGGVHVTSASLSPSRRQSPAPISRPMSQAGDIVNSSLDQIRYQDASSIVGNGMQPGNGDFHNPPVRQQALPSGFKAQSVAGDVPNQSSLHSQLTSAAAQASGSMSSHASSGSISALSDGAQSSQVSQVGSDDGVAGDGVGIVQIPTTEGNHQTIDSTLR